MLTATLTGLERFVGEVKEEAKEEVVEELRSAQES